MSGLLSNEHHRFEASWHDALSAFKTTGASTDSAALLEVFANDLRRHIQDEEKVLFPAFEQRTGMETGPTVVMRMEHRQMEAALDELSAIVAQRDGLQQPAQLAGQFLALMESHDKKEEGMLSDDG